ncbi:ABC transporter permease [Streptomyces longwoodensis]|uniref:ABC transporter permease n=1 Tax=Streptomyces longwoodensis TaxID=68231 RepID=UPI002ED191C7|nr:ABC transporter permease [Streptomyces longwoodensis]
MIVLADGLTLVERKLLHLRHQPGTLVAMLVMPAVMVVLFGFVFGSAIKVPGGGSYREYLMPGLFVMTGMFALSSAMVDVATDQGRGVTDRLRSMPTARAAVPVGQTGADTVTGLFGLLILLTSGLAFGWRAHHGLGHALGALGVLLLFRYTMSWVGTYLGLIMPSAQTADALAPLTLPLSMLSNAFVPTDGMPGWLRVVCEGNPLSAAVAACRSLFGNPGATAAGGSWPLTHPLAATLLWSAFLLALFVPLSVRRFTRAGL